MLANCKYHPLKTAHFHCEYCESDFCNSCSDESPLSHDVTASLACVLCSNPLTELNTSPNIEPFWRNLKGMYQYPLTTPGIITLLLVSLISSIAPNSLLLHFLSLILLIHYASACLNKTANGVMQPPIMDDLVTADISALFKIYFVIFLMILITFIVSGVLAELGYLVMIFFIIAFPASIIILSIDEKFSNAINPKLLLKVITTTGASYVLMCLFSLIMFSSIALIEEFILSSHPTFINYFLTEFISSYYIIIIFHLLGYIVYQHHNELNFSASNVERDIITRSDSKRQQDHLELLIKAGHFFKAAEKSSAALKNNNATLSEWNRCFELSLISKKETALIEFLNRYFEKLSESKQDNLMADTYLKSRKRVKTYQPKSHLVWLKIAQGLIEIGHYKTAISLLNGFHKSCKDKTLAITGYELLDLSFSNLPGYEKHAAQNKKLAAMLKI